ncbi:hypothetical protein MsAg5_07890 [Methanosarcinaceae archaeon Ag5]|uniref:Uncharacterized protein n=1 Tax=Methanolapillus africanus TaxID=3028297 RepID=A0AAE4MIQ2_9EURY|nr:hypothetical protein [Methanosarcinaceae archaeon Ag5]
MSKKLIFLTRFARLYFLNPCHWLTRAMSLHAENVMRKYICMIYHLGIMNDIDLSRLQNSVIHYMIHKGSLDRIDDADALTICMMKDMSRSYAA